MHTLDKITRTLVKILAFMGGVFLIVMICLTCANIFTRIVWLPIRGTFEFMGYFGAIVTAFALAYTEANKGHIAVDVVITGFSNKTKRVLHAVNSIIGFLFFALVTWHIAEKASILKKTGEVTETLQIIYYPFTYAVALGFGVLSLVLIVNAIKSLYPGKEDGN